MIIGSYAIKHWYPDFREPEDIDIVNDKYFKNTTGLRIEHSINPVIAKCYPFDKIANPRLLLTLKLSHLACRDFRWEKHFNDALFLFSKGVKPMKEVYEELFQHWLKRFKINRSNLQRSAESFFTNNIKYPIPHDDLHEILVKHPYFNLSEPTYKKVLKDGCEVEVDEKKFDKLTLQEKVNLVLEEVIVMSEERNISFEEMLKKFIISHAPSWEAYFILNNYSLFKKPFDYQNYFKTMENRPVLTNEQVIALAKEFNSFEFLTKIDSKHGSINDEYFNYFQSKLNPTLVYERNEWQDSNGTWLNTVKLTIKKEGTKPKSFTKVEGSINVPFELMAKIASLEKDDHSFEQASDFHRENDEAASYYFNTATPNVYVEVCFFLNSDGGLEPSTCKISLVKGSADTSFEFEKP